MATTYYAWSDLWLGGEAETQKAPGGREFKVVTSRVIVQRGEKITKAKSGLSDEGWDEMIDSGSIRPYPLPDGADEYTSPATAMIRALVNAQGDIDVNKIMEMGFTNVPAASDEEESEVPVGA